MKTKTNRNKISPGLKTWLDAGDSISVVVLFKEGLTNEQMEAMMDSVSVLPSEIKSSRVLVHCGRNSIRRISTLKEVISIEFDI